MKRLQRLLNVRLRPSPQLAADGLFGPLTLQAVTQYQRALSLAADGVVGKNTWYRLVKGDSVAVQVSSAPVKPGLAGGSARSGQATQAPIGSIPAGSLSSASTYGVGQWCLEDKFAEALRRTGPKLPASMQNEFAALLTPAGIGIAAGTLALWAAGHFFGVSEIVDVVLLLSGIVFLGMAAFTVGEELGAFLKITCNAESEGDLDDAASHLAHAIAIMGVVAFMALLAKVAARFRGRGGGAGEGGGEPGPSKPAPKPKAKPIQEQPLDDPTNVAAHEKYKTQLRKGQAATDIEEGKVFDTTKMSPNEKAALKEFDSNPNSYRNAKRLSQELGGKKKGAEVIGQLEREAAAGQCTKRTVPIRAPGGGTQDMAMYEYPDGTVVRVKPQGDAFRNGGTTYSVEGKHAGMRNADGTWQPDSGPESAAFKVDEHGNAVPKNPDQIKNPYDSSTEPRSANEYKDAVMDAGHKGPLP